MDGIVIASIVYELKKNILGAHVNKIYQPEKNEILLFVKKKRILLSANANYPGIYFLSEKKYKENPVNAPMFCMILRKYILNAKIIDIEQINFDRIINFKLENVDEFGDRFFYDLIIEIMGKHSNTILVDKNEKNIILDAIKHIDFKKSSKREILPGLEYKLICDENKFDLRKISENEFVDLIKKNDAPEKIFNGFGKLMATEINFRKKNDLDYKVIRKDILENKFMNQVLFDKENNAKYLASVDLKSLADYKKESYESVFDAIEKFYSDKIKHDYLKQKKSDLEKIILGNILKYEKKIELQKKDLARAKDKDELKLFAELIMANAYKNFVWQEFIFLENYYDGNKKIRINLDKNLSLVENANLYFKKYNKKKRAENVLIEQINKNKIELEYFKSVEENLNLCESDEDIDNIRDELYEQKIIKKRVKNKKNKIEKKKNLPMRFVSNDGFDIYVGKNNLQNDYLSFKFANGNDIWLHVKNMPSAHVIIRLNQKNISEQAIFEAANICVFYSKAKDLKNVEVDYTQKKFIKKMPGARPGMVIYKNYKTLCISVDKNLIEKLKWDEKYE